MISSAVKEYNYVLTQKIKTLKLRLILSTKFLLVKKGLNECINGLERKIQTTEIRNIYMDYL